MSQYGTGLARSTLGRATKMPGQIPPAGAPLDEQVAPLHGVMTGLANLVNEHLSRLTIGPQATRFLRHLERQTFGNAGLHRRAGRSDPGLWCPYVHAEWAEALAVSASALTHLRVRLVEAGIIWYRPDPDRRGRGAVGWSFDFASWKPLPWGGARAGAGRPRATLTVPERSGSAAPGHSRTARAAKRPMEGKVPKSSPHVQKAAMPSTDAVPTALTTSSPAIQDVNKDSVEDGACEFKASTTANQDVNTTAPPVQSPPCASGSRKRGFFQE
jgi:hypothetical protein